MIFEGTLIKFYIPHILPTSGWLYIEASPNGRRLFRSTEAEMGAACRTRNPSSPRRSQRTRHPSPDDEGGNPR